jgi:hypothetical protein
MNQTAFADNGFGLATKKTRKRVFLEEMKASSHGRGLLL